MNIESILVPQRTFGSLRASSKKRAIELAAEKIAKTLPDIESGVVYRQLIEREKLGTTAIGSGVALPHCRLPDCEKIVGSLFIFEEPIDFSAYDDIPVNIMFVLLVPETETEKHLSTLAMLAERFDQIGFRENLIQAGSNERLFSEAIALDQTNPLQSAHQQ